MSNTPAASSPPGCLEFHDEVLAIGPEIQELKAEGVDVIIVLGHSGIDTDLEIAKQLPDIDLIGILTLSSGTKMSKVLFLPNPGQSRTILQFCKLSSDLVTLEQLI